MFLEASKGNIEFWNLGDWRTRSIVRHNLYPSSSFPMILSWVKFETETIIDLVNCSEMHNSMFSSETTGDISPEWTIYRSSWLSVSLVFFLGCGKLLKNKTNFSRFTVAQARPEAENHFKGPESNYDLKPSLQHSTKITERTVVWSVTHH